MVENLPVRQGRKRAEFGVWVCVHTPSPPLPGRARAASSFHFLNSQTSLHLSPALSGSGSPFVTSSFCIHKGRLVVLRPSDTRKFRRKIQRTVVSPTTTPTNPRNSIIKHREKELAFSPAGGAGGAERQREDKRNYANRYVERNKN